MRGLFAFCAAAVAFSCACASAKTVKVGDFDALQKAVDQASAGDTIILNGGIYYGTLKIKNSGEKGKPITIKCAPQENVVISAADKITSKWTKYKGGIYVADVDWSGPEGRNQLFMDDEIMIEARYPNIANEKEIMEVAINKSKMVEGTSYMKRVEIAGDKFIESQPENAFAGCVYWGMHGQAWAAQCARVSGSKGKELFVEEICKSWWWAKDGKNFIAYQEGKGKGMLVGALALLDVPREWFYDASAKKLYFYPPDGKDPNKLNLYFKKRSVVIDMEATSYVVVSGINGLGGSINMLKTKNCVLEHGTFKALSHFNFYAHSRGDLIFDNGNTFDLGGAGLLVSGEGDTIRNLSLSYSAGAVVLLGGKNHVVKNNFISDGGYMGTYRSGIFVASQDCGLDRGGHVFEGNTITRVGRSCIHFTSGPKENKDFSYDTSFRACDIIGNHFSDFLMMANDGGAVYGWHVNFGSDRPAQWAYNWIENSKSRELGSGLYPDNFCFNVQMHNNVIRNVQEGIRINHICENVDMYNNTFWDISVRTIAQWIDKDKQNLKMNFFNNVSDSDKWEHSKTDVKENNLTSKDAEKLFECKGDGMLYFFPKAGSDLVGKGKVLDRSKFPGAHNDIGAYSVSGKRWTAGVKTKRHHNPILRN